MKNLGEAYIFVAEIDKTHMEKKFVCLSQRIEKMLKFFLAL